jgi:uncharacterized protein (TIGR04141 family)
MPNIETITVYLLKESVEATADAVRSSADNYSQHTVRAGETVGTVFVAEFDDKEPAWVRLLNPVTQPPVADDTSSTGALLVIPGLRSRLGTGAIFSIRRYMFGVLACG